MIDFNVYEQHRLTPSPILENEILSMGCSNNWKPLSKTNAFTIFLENVIIDLSPQLSKQTSK